MKQWSIQRGAARYKLALYTLAIFILMIGGGELISRTVLSRQSAAANPLESANYTPAANQYAQIQNYVAKYGVPDCIFFGSSLVQVGINPEIFQRAYQEKTGESLSCFNFGADGSSMSSTADMALILSRAYKPKLVIVGLHASSFLMPNSPTTIAEQRFHTSGWVRYSLGEFSPEGWLLTHSMMYRLLGHYAFQLFPNQTGADIPKTIFHPEIARIVADNGYSPLVAYRDTSPLFQPPDVAQSAASINPEAVDEYYQLLQTAEKEHIPIILIEMPTPKKLPFADALIDAAKTYARQHGFPVLSLQKVAALPATSFTDAQHMQISGSFMFSDWLGNQIGQAAVAGALSRPADAVWSPTLATWPATAYAATLGLSQSSYAAYQSAVANFNLTEPNAIIFNPSPVGLDRTYAQSLVGLAIDWQSKLSDTQRTQFLQLMTVLGNMRYQNDLALSASASAQVDRWRSTLDPSLLTTLGIQYVLCRKELVPPINAVQHCPSAIATTPAYRLIGSWDFTPLYERYFLYQIEPPSEVF